MSKGIIAQNEEIVIGVDVSDAKHNIAVVNTRGEIVEQIEMRGPTREKWAKYLERFPGCAVKVIYEAGPQGYTLYDTIREFGGDAVVIAPVKTIGIKTDRRDALRIVRDFVSGSARVITVPDRKKRVMRQLLRQRHQIKKDIVRIKNRMSALTRFHGLVGTFRAVFTRKRDVQVLTFCFEQQQEMCAFLEKKRDEIDALLEQVARDPEYRDDIGKLKEIKGIGTLTALEIALNVADITAFGDGASFASYCGLCPGEWSSGATRRLGHITRRGPGRLRGALVQCAWSAVRYDLEEKKKFNELKTRIGKKKAIVAIARRLSVRVWNKLNPREAAQAA